MKKKFSKILISSALLATALAFLNPGVALGDHGNGSCFTLNKKGQLETAGNSKGFTEAECTAKGVEEGKEVRFFPGGTQVGPDGNPVPIGSVQEGLNGKLVPVGQECGGLVQDTLNGVVIKCAFEQAFATVLFIPLGLTSLLLGLSGTLLNAVLNFSVINLTANISAITGIPIAWGFLRDISNMVFIFVLIYIAIKTILGLGNNKMKQTLVAVVIAALLINFSLFFTKVMIDASNLLALTFYEKAVPNAGAGNLLTTGLSNSFMQPLGLTSFYDVTQGSGLLASLGSLGKVATVSLFGSLFFIILAFVFLAVSVMFLIRYVNIIFLLILSPVAFLGSVLPGFGEKVRGWWTKSLSGNLVFAPIYMILTFAVLSVISSDGFISTIRATGGSGTSAATAGSASVVASSFSAIVGDPTTATQSTFGLVMNFIVVIVLAIGTLIISKTVADQGGSIGAKVVGGVLGTGAGVAGFGGRRIIGGGARMAANSEKLREAASKKGLAGFGARLALKTSQGAAKGSFDVRGSKALGAVGGAVGFDATKEFGLGKAEGKGGYDAIVKEKIKKQEDFAKSLGPTEIEKDEAKQELAEAKKSGDKERIRVAQERVDEIEGVSEKEVERRTKKLEDEKEKKLKDSSVLAEEKKLEEEIAKEEKEIETATIDPGEEEKERRIQILELKKKELEKVKEVANTTRESIEKDYEEEKSRIKEIDSIGKQRAAAYAKHITEPASMNVFGWNIPLPSAHRVGFILPAVSYSSRMSAAKIRGGKSTKDSLVEMAKKLAKEEGEEDADKEKDKGEEKKDDKDKDTTPSAGASSPKT